MRESGSVKESRSGSDSWKFGVRFGLGSDRLHPRVGIPASIATAAGLKRSLSFSPGWIFGRLKMTSSADCYPAMVENPSRIVA